MMAHTIHDYLSEIPRAVPPGKILVHNKVEPSREIGLNGFRIWLQSEDSNVLACDCGWAPKLGTHYRVFGSRKADDKLKN